MKNNNFIITLLNQAIQDLNNQTEMNSEQQEFALECLQAANTLANYEYNIDFEKESGLTDKSSIDDIIEEIYILCGPPRMNMRSESEIYDYLDEAFDKVWYCRTSPSTNKEIEEKRLDAVKRIKEKYGTGLDKLENPTTGDWEYGYYSGILSALRWIMGNEKDSLDT